MLACWLAGLFVCLFVCACASSCSLVTWSWIQSGSSSLVSCRSLFFCLLVSLFCLFSCLFRLLALSVRLYPLPLSILFVHHKLTSFSFLLQLSSFLLTHSFLLQLTQDTFRWIFLVASVTGCLRFSFFYLTVSKGSHRLWLFGIFFVPLFCLLVVCFGLIVFGVLFPHQVRRTRSERDEMMTKRTREPCSTARRSYPRGGGKRLRCWIISIWHHSLLESLLVHIFVSFCHHPRLRWPLIFPLYFFVSWSIQTQEDFMCRENECQKKTTDHTEQWPQWNTKSTDQKGSSSSCCCSFAPSTKSEWKQRRCDNERRHEALTSPRQKRTSNTKFPCFCHKAITRKRRKQTVRRKKKEYKSKWRKKRSTAREK